VLVDGREEEAQAQRRGHARKYQFVRSGYWPQDARRSTVVWRRPGREGSKHLFAS
jgi:hypothetical protein